jgi:hypothetical protein
VGHRRTQPAVAAGALLAVLVASVGLGWIAADSMSGRVAADPGVRADPAEPTYEADGPGARLPAPPPQAATAPAPAPSPVPVTAPSDAAPAPGAPPPGASAPQSAPAPPDPPPAPSPEPAPSPPPASPPTSPPELRPYQRPPALGIASEALPPEGRAWGLVADARRSAPPGSQERADLDWIISYARMAGVPGAPEGRRAAARRALRVNAWWYGSRPSPAERVIARDPEGVILTYKRGYGFTVNPVATIGRWRDLNEAWSPAQLAEAVLPMMVERTHEGTEWAALEYFDVPGDPSAVRPGVSGMAQARAVGLLAKAWATTGDPRFAEGAERALRAFTVPVDAGGVLSRVPDPAGGPPGPWYPERAYPGSLPWTGAALNGFMVTLIELRRAAESLAQSAPVTAEPASTTATTPGSAGAPHAATARMARAVADRGARSLARFLPLHDTGSWSLYGLRTPGKPWRTYLADLNYHCYHVSLLRSLDTLYPADGHQAAAARWQSYVDERGATCPAR